MWGCSQFREIECLAIRAQSALSVAKDVIAAKARVCITRWVSTGALPAAESIQVAAKDPTLTMVRSNLRGACRACNSALGNGGVKGLHLRIWPPCLAFVVAEPEPLPPRPDCRICGSSVVGHRGRKYCSEACRVEANARYQRDRYRAAQCLPVDSSKPTKPFERRRLWLDVDQHRKIPVSAAG